MRSAARFAIVITLAALCASASGCAFRTYTVNKERRDMDLEAGNRGFVSGDVAEAPQPKTTRQVRIWEFEMLPLKKSVDASKRAAREKPAAAATEQEAEQEEAGVLQESAPVAPDTVMEKYVVQANDTLQKIAMKFYGKSSRWKEIFDANKDALKTPDRIFPGQTLLVPVPASRAQQPPEDYLK